MKIAAIILIWAITALSALVTVTYAQAILDKDVFGLFGGILFYHVALSSFAIIMGLVLRRAWGGDMSQAANVALISGLVGLAVFAASFFF